jgi:hypothetical protein
LGITHLVPPEKLPPLERTATLTKEQELALRQERSQHLRRHQEALTTHTSQGDS